MRPLTLISLASSLAANWLALSVSAKSASGQRILVVLEHALSKTDYSNFWDSLQARGFELTFKGPKEEQNPLVEYGEKQFDHLIMMTPSTSAFAAHLKPQALLESGINTLFLTSSAQSDSQTAFYREFDLEFASKGHGLITHHPHLASDSRVQFELQDGLDEETPVTVIDERTRRQGREGKKLVYEGITHTPGYLNPFVIPVLHAPKGSFVGLVSSGEEEDDEEEELVKGKGDKLKQVIAGKDAGLVSVFQSRANVRFGWVGGVAMVKNDVWTEDSLNPAFVSSLTSWIFQETGVVKVINTEHYRLSKDQNGTSVRESRDRFGGYTVKESVNYEITLAQHDAVADTWIPIKIDDLQLDFTMLDPHLRTGLDYAGDTITTQGGASIYKKTFNVPDRHGVFKFVVDWWRPGYTFVHESMTTSVIPFRHDEYPRFIQGAYPFYAGAFVVAVSFLLFSGLWLHLGAGEQGRKLKDGKKEK